MSWKEHIVEAFERALSLGKTGDVRPKPQFAEINLRLEQAPEINGSFTPGELRAMHYTQSQADEFQADALELIEESVAAVDATETAESQAQGKHRRHSALVHRSYYIGELRPGPVTPADYTKAVERCVSMLDKKEAPKQSLVAKVANTKVF